MGQNLISSGSPSWIQRQEGDEEFVARSCQERELGSNDGAHILLCPR